MSRTFRYNLASDVAEAVSQFAQLHKSDALKDYKDAWEEWQKANEDLIIRETRRLSAEGYTGDVADKIYKAGRYYYRRPKAKSNPEQTVQIRRKTYIGLDSSILESMDGFLTQSYNSSEHFAKPSVLYAEFLKSNEMMIVSEIKRLEELIDEDEVRLKIKKTFKNRYYVLQRKLNKES